MPFGVPATLCLSTSGLPGWLRRVDPFRPGPLPDGLSQGERAFFRTSLAWLVLLVALGVVSQVARHWGLGRVESHFNLSTAGFDLITNSGFLGIFLCYGRLRSGWRDQARVVALGLLLEAVLWSLRPPNWGLTGSLLTVGLGLGSAAALGLAAQAVLGGPQVRTRARGYLVLAAFMMLFPHVTLWAHFAVIDWTPQVYDLFAYQVDGLAGFQPSFAVGALLEGSPVLLSLAMLVYNELPLLLFLALFLALDHPERAYNQVISSFAGMGLAGFLLYNLYPASGLVILFPETFPQGPAPPWDGLPHLLELPGTRNCMPSLHMSWILCLAFAVFRMGRRVRAAALVVVGFTVLSTLYLGHYWIDLVAAFPLALSFQALTASGLSWKAPARGQALAGGLGMLGVALVSLRWFHPWVVACPALTLGAQAGIILGSLLLEHRLARAALNGPRNPARNPSVEVSDRLPRLAQT